MLKKINLIVAACSNDGIGNNGSIPWKLKNEMAFFKKLTTLTEDSNKRNAVIMGRKTWESIPEKFRPLPNRLNIVLSKNLSRSAETNNLLIYKSLRDALDVLENSYDNEIENVWIIGGYSVYFESMQLNNCHRIYKTNIMKSFECDTFFPKIPDNFKLIKLPEVTDEIQCENGIDYQFQVYEKQ